HSTEDPGGCEARSVSLAEPNIRRLAAMPDGASLCVAGAPAASEFAATGMLHPFALPILIGDELAGAIVLAEDTGCPLDAESRSHLRELADRIAVALATARRDHELHRRANYDALTHLPNRLLGMEELSRAVAAASR